MKDPALKLAKGAALSKERPATTEDDPMELKRISREFPKLQVHDDILIIYRCISKPDGGCQRQLVLPVEFRKQAMVSLHNDLGHLGIERTVALARDRFYLPRMTSDIEEWIRHCDRCLVRKSFPKVAVPLQHIKTSSPMELVCMNFVRVAKILWKQYFRHNGLPKRLHSDQGPEFESKVIEQLTTMLGVQKSHTTPYHPQGNPQPERFNRTLLNMLGTLTKEEKINWSRHVSALVHAYNLLH